MRIRNRSPCLQSFVARWNNDKGTGLARYPQSHRGLTLVGIRQDSVWTKSVFHPGVRSDHGDTEMSPCSVTQPSLCYRHSRSPVHSFTICIYTLVYQMRGVRSHCHSHTLTHTPTHQQGSHLFAKSNSWDFPIFPFFFPFFFLDS